MLIELYGSNYGCFRDEFRLSMVATGIEPDSERGTIAVSIDGEVEPLLLLRCIALYGPNASGKSTLLRAAEAMADLLAKSSGYSSDLEVSHYEPFRLNATSRNEPVRLGVRAVIDGRVYDYSFGFDDTEFTNEVLVEIGPSATTTLFHRNGHVVQGPWTEHPQFGLLAAAFRPNALLLSLADKVATSLASNIASGLRAALGTRYDYAHFGPPVALGDMSVASRVKDDDSFGLWLRDRLRDADVGIVDLHVRPMVRVLNKHAESSSADPRRSYRLMFTHGGESAAILPYSRESTGTRRLIQLAPHLFDLTNPGIARTILVDEMDASMHPLLLRNIIKHINCDASRDRMNGQLIFATHETGLMDGEARHGVLRRDQIYFTEKNSEGAARLYSLAEYSERNNLNIRKRYLQGRYGGLPLLGDYED
jgi:hypothetical protein